MFQWRLLLCKSIFPGFLVRGGTAIATRLLFRWQSTIMFHLKMAFNCVSVEETLSLLLFLSSRKLNYILYSLLCTNTVSRLHSILLNRFDYEPKQVKSFTENAGPEASRVILSNQIKVLVFPSFNLKGTVQKDDIVSLCILFYVWINEKKAWHITYAIFISPWKSRSRVEWKDTSNFSSFYN